MLDSSETVSLQDTTGSDFLRGMQAWSSSKSFRQISRWSSPAPAMMCSPDSSIMHCTIGSDLASRLRPSTSLGRSAGFLGSTATRTTGDTLNFMTFMLCASFKVEMAPVLATLVLVTDTLVPTATASLPPVSTLPTSPSLAGDSTKQTSTANFVIHSALYNEKDTVWCQFSSRKN